MTREELIEALVARKGFERFNSQANKSAYWNTIVKKQKFSDAVFSSSHPEFKARQRLSKRQVKSLYTGNTKRFNRLKDLESQWDFGELLIGSKKRADLSHWDKRLPRNH